MKMVEKRLVTISVTILCLVFICGAMLPLSLAATASSSPPVTVANVSGTHGQNGWYTSSVTITLTATDYSGTGINRTVYSTDNGATYTNYTSPFTVTGEGNRTILFRSYDNAGNKESYKALNVAIDTINPVATAAVVKGYSPVSGWYNSTVTINITATDSGSKIWYIEYSNDSGASWTIYTKNFTMSDDGAHTIIYKAHDWAGNMDVHDGLIQPGLHVDISNISVIAHKTGTIINPQDVWYSTNVRISLSPQGSGNDGVKYIQYSFDNKTWVTDDTFMVTGEGYHKLYYRAIDNADIIGNVTVDGVGIDITPATVNAVPSGTSDKSKGWWIGSVTITLNAYAPSSYTWTYYSWDKKNWIYYTGPFKVSGPTKTLYYRTCDYAGKMSGTYVDGKSLWLYFAPATYDQGGMSNQVYINGATTGPSSGTGTATAVPIPSTVPVPTPTQVPMPTPTYVPADTGNDLSSGSGAPLAVAVLVGVLVLLGIIAAAAYLFVFKPK